MKKFISILLTLTLLMLTSCGNASVTTEQTTESTSSAQITESSTTAATTEAHVTVGEIDYSKIIIPVTRSYAQDIPTDREELIALLNTNREVFGKYMRMHLAGHIEEEKFSDMLNYSTYEYLDDRGYLYTQFYIDPEKLDVESFANVLEQLTRYSDISRIELQQHEIADAA